MEIAALLVNLVKIYLAIGALIALLFLVIGIDRVDRAAHGAYAFRPLLFPGVAVLWPLVLWRWLALERQSS